METRRAILAQIALGLGVLACRGGPISAQHAEQAAYVAIETSPETGVSRARFLSGTGGPIGITPLDFRAHGMTRQDRYLIVFPRRPGNRFAVMDNRTLEILRLVTAPPDRHFYGHGAFTCDAGQLLVTENDLGTLSGSLGVYDVATGFRRLGQIALPGPGPHDIVRDPARDRFHVALGGLETHPAYGRTPLNLAEFRSQIVTLDLDRGQVDQMGFWPGTEGVSLRHLAVDGSGRLHAGGQLVDPGRGTPERVLWSLNAGGAVALADGALLGGYVSSVTSHGPDTLVTSKAVHRALKLTGGKVADLYTIEGASAAALGPRLAGLSGYETLRLNDLEIAVSDGFEFDNHGLAVV